MKPIAKRQDELDKPQDEIPVKQYRFAKNQSPWEHETLKSGVIISWRRPVKNGVLESYGFFETPDPIVAKELREYAAENPNRRIFEQEE